MKMLVSMTASSVTSFRPAFSGKVDGKRKRRHSQLKARRDWYAKHRAERFARHFGFN